MRFSPRAWRQAHSQAACQSLGDLCRRPVGSLMAWLVIAIAWTLPALLFFVLQNVQTLNMRWQGSKPTASVYLKDQLESKQQAIANRIRRMPAVLSVRLITPDDAMKHLQSVIHLQDLSSALPKNPLPTVLVVQPKPQIFTGENPSQLKAQLAALPGIDFVQWDLDWLKKLLSFVALGRQFLFLLAGALAVGVILIIANTTRLSLMQHRKEIDILGLIGATASFIRRPFLYRGLWLGLGGGILSCLLLISIKAALLPYVDELTALYNSSFQFMMGNPSDWVILITLSTIAGVLGALFACFRVNLSPSLSE